AGSCESRRSWPKFSRFAGDGHFHFALADQKQFFLLMAMRVMRRTPRQQKNFVDVDAHTAVHQSIDDRPECCVRFFMRGEVLEAKGSRLERALARAYLR